MALGLYLLIARTRVGMLVRAGATNREMVRALGVDIGLLYTFVFGLGALLAGFAGVMAGPLYGVTAGMGEQILILTFVVVVIGGVGSIRGAFYGALLVGARSSIRCCAPICPGFLRLFMVGPEADALGGGIGSMGVYMLMAVVLALKPKGLFPSPWMKTSPSPQASSAHWRRRLHSAGALPRPARCPAAAGGAIRTSAQ